MKPKIRELLERCIEDGVALGYHRAFKHDEVPSEEWVRQCIVNSIWLEIDEWFDIDSNS